MRLGPQRAAFALILVSVAGTVAACGRERTVQPAPEAVPATPPPSAPPASSAAPATAPVPSAGPSEMLSLGAERYTRMCAVCHGPTGEGYRADNATAIAHPDFLGSATDDYLRRAIANGRTGTTMSAWSTMRGGPLSPDDVNAVVAYIRTWEKAPKVSLDERPVSGDVARGATLYVRECQHCHGPRGTGGPNVRIGDHELLATASNGFLRLAIGKGRPGTPMLAFAEKLGDQGVEDLVAYLRNVQQDPEPFEPPRAMRPPPLPLGPMPLNPKGPEPKGFSAHPAMTPVDVVHAQLKRRARLGILDARAPSDYVNDHIAGAVSVPFYDPAPYLTQLPKNTWLICYCACPHAESGILATKLKENGFKKVSVLNEGLGVWKARGYPTKSGIEP